MPEITQELRDFEAAVRRLDIWVAAAWQIPEEYRYGRHYLALDKCAGLVIWLDLKREAIPTCREVITKLMPILPILDGHYSWEGHAWRVKDREAILKALLG